MSAGKGILARFWEGYSPEIKLIDTWNYLVGHLKNASQIGPFPRDPDENNKKNELSCHHLGNY